MAGDTPKPVIFTSYSHKDEPEHPRAHEAQWLTFVRTYFADLPPRVRTRGVWLHHPDVRADFGGEHFRVNRSQPQSSYFSGLVCNTNTQSSTRTTASPG